MPTWTVSRGAASCGACSVAIAAGDPMCRLTLAGLIRCQSCAGQLGYLAPAVVAPEAAGVGGRPDDWSRLNPSPALPFEEVES